jgi:hypothetical protein
MVMIERTSSPAPLSLRRQRLAADCHIRWAVAMDLSAGRRRCERGTVHPAPLGHAMAHVEAMEETGVGTGYRPM